MSGLIVLCKTQYQFSRKIAVKYIIEWTDENGQIKSIYSLSSAGAAGSLFLKVSSLIYIKMKQLNYIVFIIFNNLYFIGNM